MGQVVTTTDVVSVSTCHVVPSAPTVPGFFAVMLAQVGKWSVKAAAALLEITHWAAVDFLDSSTIGPSSSSCKELLELLVAAGAVTTVLKQMNTTNAAFQTGSVAIVGMFATSG